MYQKRVKKRNSYTVAFTDPQDPPQHRYGRVEMFFTCPADTPDGIHVTKLIVDKCRELSNMNYPSEIQNLAPELCTDFVSVIRESDKSCYSSRTYSF